MGSAPRPSPSGPPCFQRGSLNVAWTLQQSPGESPFTFCLLSRNPVAWEEEDVWVPWGKEAVGSPFPGLACRTPSSPLLCLA